MGAISMDAMKIGSLSVEKGGPLFLIAGPCVIESEDLVLEVAAFLKDASTKLGAPVIFKASFDKDNRTSLHSFRGPGLDRGLEILRKVKRETGLPVLSDVHEPSQIEQVSAVLDAIQIPAFLCRQTDLLVAAGRTGLPVNVKKGQFLSPWEMGNLKEMQSKWVAGVSMLGYGCSLAMGLGVPIPVLDEEMARFTGVSDDEIFTQIVDYGNDYPKGEAKSLGRVSYGDLKSGVIRFNGRDVPTVPMSSYVRALEVAQILKEWIEKGEFLLTEPQVMLPSDRTR